MASPPYLTAQEFLNQTIPGSVFRDMGTPLIEEGISWASDTADSYLRKRFKMPLVSFGNDIKRAVANIAQYELMARRGFRPDAGQDQIIVKRNDDAVAWLRDVSKGLCECSAVDSTFDDEDGPLASSAPAGDFSMTTGRRCECGCCDWCMNWRSLG